MTKQITVEIQVTEDDLKELSRYHKEDGIRDAEDNLHRALWGCGCCEAGNVDLITDGVRSKITDALILMIEKEV